MEATRFLMWTLSSSAVVEEAVWLGWPPPSSSSGDSTSKSPGLHIVYNTCSRPQALVYGVEPETANTMHQSLLQGHPVTDPKAKYVHSKNTRFSLSMPGAVLLD